MLCHAAVELAKCTTHNYTILLAPAVAAGSLSSFQAPFEGSIDLICAENATHLQQALCSAPAPYEHCMPIICAHAHQRLPIGRERQALHATHALRRETSAACAASCCCARCQCRGQRGVMACGPSSVSAAATCAQCFARQRFARQRKPLGRRVTHHAHHATSSSLFTPTATLP